jgi:hypothetical protein
MAVLRSPRASARKAFSSSDERCEEASDVMPFMLWGYLNCNPHATGFRGHRTAGASDPAPLRPAGC